MSSLKLNAQQLLRIPLSQPEQLFSADRDSSRETWRRLGRQWHPDRNSEREASWVFAHIQSLYQSALDRIELGLWDDGKCLELRDERGRKFRLRYQISADHELGRCLIGRGVIAYLFQGEAMDWAERGRDVLQRMNWANDAMRAAMAAQLPTFIRLVKGEEFRLLLVEKGTDFVPMASLKAALGGAIPPRHVAWIVSALLNITSYLEWAGLCHLAIAEEHCLVSPQGHSVNLTGGWWFAKEQGADLTALPARSAALAPPDTLIRQQADGRIDAALIRQLGLELLGDKATEAPTAMQDFLALPGSGSAVQDYEDWQKALWASFGERRFSALAISADDIFQMASDSQQERRN